MGGHGLGVFKRTAIVEICRDARGAEGVIADCRGNAGLERPLSLMTRMFLQWLLRHENNQHAPSLAYDRQVNRIPGFNVLQRLHQFENVLYAVAVHADYKISGFIEP